MSNSGLVGSSYCKLHSSLHMYKIRQNWPCQRETWVRKGMFWNLTMQTFVKNPQMRERRAQEMMLYKTRGFYGGSAITKTYCPINGNYKFTYSINDGTEDDLECNEAVSEASDCPTGYKFDLKFRGCSFPDFGELLLSTQSVSDVMS